MAYDFDSALKEGYSPQDITNYLHSKGRGAEADGYFGVTERPSYLQRVKEGVSSTLKGLGSDLVQQADVASSKQSLGDKVKAVARGGLRTVGATARAALTPVMEAPGIKQATEFVGNKIASTGVGKKIGELAQKNPELAKDVQDVVDVAGLFGGKAVTKPIKKSVSNATKSVRTSVKNISPTRIVGEVENVVKNSRKIIDPPPPKPAEAMGQILQGKSGDVSEGFKALRKVDTTGVKTYNDLFSKVGDSIKDLSRQVDATLDNTTPIRLKDLKVTAKTQGGQKVSVDYVTRAVSNLKELYTSIGDDVVAKEMDELVNKAKTIGLTRQEVNNLSRRYGIEFSEKAFNKEGNPLTSVSAQRFENTRKALKKIARDGMGGTKAADLDDSISSLYRVEGLVKKNVEAVNRLNQKIQERGLLEKVGYQAAKVADVMTGGSLRGIIGGLLPRGVGYKVMNAIDLEKALQRNLEIITKALNDGEYMKKLLKKVSENPPKNNQGNVAQ